MVAVNFYIRDKKAKNKTSIFLFFNHEKERLKFSTGLTIDPKFWNARKQRARLTMADSSNLNQELEKSEEKIMMLYSELKRKGEFTLKRLHQSFLGVEPKQMKRFKNLSKRGHSLLPKQQLILLICQKKVWSI